MHARITVRVRKELEHSHGYTSENPAGDDRLLVAEAKSGCSSAFGELYERHRLRTYHAAFRILRSRQDAEDAVQRCFQRALTSLARFREDSSFSTWVTRIAINEALMLLRQRRSKREVPESLSEGTAAPSFLVLPDDGPTPEQAFAQAELRSVVLRAISKLRHSLRAVILLREVHGLTNAETARRLGLSVGAVKARTFHARRHLRRHLEGKFKELMPLCDRCDTTVSAILSSNRFRSASKA